MADIDTLQEDNFDVDSGRHFDHRLILLGALDQIFRDHVARLGHALAKASLQNLTVQNFFALPFVVIFVPLNTVFPFAEKPPPKPPARTRVDAWVTSQALRGHNRPPPPVRSEGPPSGPQAPTRTSVSG